MNDKVTDIGSRFSGLASALISRAKLAAKAGMTFDDKRDLYKVLGYKRSLVFSDYLDRYNRGGIAGRIVDSMSASTWRTPPRIKDNSSNDITEFDKVVARLTTRLNMYHYFERADKLSGIGSYGLLLIGAPGPLEHPIPRLNGEGEILYFSVFNEGDTTVHSLENNTSSPRFGLPLLYDIKMLGANATATISPETTIQRKVHHSRIIHIAEGLVEDEIHGTPRLQRVWNYLDDLDKIMGGSAESIWRTVDRGIQFDLDKDATLEPEDETDFADEIEEYMHGLKRHLRTQGVTANVLGSAVANPQGAFSTVASLISGTSGIPQRVLFGSERGQLASTQDERNFHARVKERMVSFAEVVILRPVIDRLIAVGGLPTPINGYEVNWPDLSTQTRKEAADVAARVAQAVRNIATQGAQNAPTVVITADEFRQHFLDLPADMGNSANIGQESDNDASDSGEDADAAEDL